jgi:hypothetical protein
VLRCLGAHSAELLCSWGIAELVLIVAVAAERGWGGSLFWDAWLAFNVPLALWPIGVGVGSAALALLQCVRSRSDAQSDSRAL